MVGLRPLFCISAFLILALPDAGAQPGDVERIRLAPGSTPPAPRITRVPPPLQAGAPLPTIVLTGYWPPTNEMIRRFSTSPTQNPAGWIGANWEGRGYDVHAFFPEFTPPDCLNCGKGTGDLEVDYQDTSTDFWNLVEPLEPMAVITFSRGFFDNSWEVEMNQFNKTNWIPDFLAPFLPNPNPPDASVPAGTKRLSSLPMQAIVDDVNNAPLPIQAYICQTGDGGGFLSEFIAYHGVWYRSIHESPTDPAWCVAAGHVHVGGQISVQNAANAARITLRAVIQHVDAERAATVCQDDLGFQGPGSATMAMCGDPLQTGGDTDFAIHDAPPSSAVVLFLSAMQQPTPFFGGTLITVPPVATAVLPTDADGGLLIEDISTGGGPATVYAQAAYADASLPVGVGLTNALKLDLLP